jgi:adenylate/guanylate cyclase family protein/zinc ribbon protein
MDPEGKAGGIKAPSCVVRTDHSWRRVGALAPLTRALAPLTGAARAPRRDCGAGASYASMVLTCPSCGQQNPEGARFCNACANPLGAESRELGEERKIVTVVFVDLVGFTAQAERLDPEDVRGLLAPYHAYVREELERRGGTVEKFIGDAVMAVFGAPAAHDDDPERAVRAALAIRDWAADPLLTCNSAQTTQNPDLQVF